jgi:hypothetical protein
MKTVWLLIIVSLTGGTAEILKMPTQAACNAYLQAIGNTSNTVATAIGKPQPLMFCVQGQVDDASPY